MAAPNRSPERRLSAALSAVSRAEAELAGAARVRNEVIRELRAGGWTLRAIAERAGMTHTQVANICRDSPDSVGNLT